MDQRVINYKYHESQKIELGTTKVILTSVPLFLALTLISVSLIPVSAQESGESYDWKVVAGAGLENNPTAVKILQNIEISKQRLEELKNAPILELTEHQKFVESQRKLAEDRLQAELDRMNEKYKDYTPRASFAKYVDKKPEIYHDFYWSLFNYLDGKVTKAREARDQVLAAGGTREQAQAAFIQHAKMPLAERVDYHNRMVLEHGMFNKVSNMEDFDKLPSETKAEFIKYAKNKLQKTGLVQTSELVVNDGASFYQVSAKSESQQLLGNLPIAQTTEPKVSQAVYESGEAVDLVTVSSAIVYSDSETVSGESIQTGQIESEPVKQTSSTFLNLNGKQYFKKSFGDMDEVSEFTISTWVKPDYSKGSTQFTIASKEGAFSLSIKRGNGQDNFARISVFDGIHWTSVDSVSPIKEEWTHIAATLDGTNLNIFVNGELEASKRFDGISGVDTFGYLDSSDPRTITSDSEILVGAQISTMRSDAKTFGFFSGMIDEIIIDDYLYENSEIIELCENSQYYTV